MFIYYYTFSLIIFISLFNNFLCFVIWYNLIIQHTISLTGSVGERQVIEILSKTFSGLTILLPT